MAQQNIDFGSFPDDPTADAIRTAFQKVQNNFDQLFAATSATVLSVNKTPGVGVTVSQPVGNVVLNANVYRINFQSSTLRIGTSPNPISTTATYENGSQTLYIDLPNYNTVSINNNISANGTNQSTATAIVRSMNIVTTVSSGQGVKLPTPTPGTVIYITNTSANTLNIYPESGGTIGSLLVNAPLTQASGNTTIYLAASSTQWYTK
jgi:hypothetical protein